MPVLCCAGACPQRRLCLCSRPRVGRKELKALQVEGPRPEQLGSVAALSPMKTPSRMRGALGADQASHLRCT